MLCHAESMGPTTNLSPQVSCLVGHYTRINSALFNIVIKKSKENGPLMIFYAYEKWKVNASLIE